MAPRRFFLRLTAVVVSNGLLLPTPAFALRGVQLRDDLSATSGLEQRLQPNAGLDHASAGLEEDAPRVYTFDVPVTRVALSMGGMRLYGAGPDGAEIKFIDLRQGKGKTRRQFRFYPTRAQRTAMTVGLYGARGLTFDASQQRLESWNLLDGTVRRIPIQDGIPVDAKFGFPLPQRYDVPTIKMRDGWMAVAFQRAISLADPISGDFRMGLELKDETHPSFAGVAVSAGGHLAARFQNSPEVVVRNLERDHLGEEMKLSHNEPVGEIVFPPHPWQAFPVLAVSGGKTVSLWHVTLRLVKTRDLLHQGSVKKMAFSADGNVLATVSKADGLSFWDVSSGKRLAELPYAQAAGTTDLVFSLNGNRLAAATGSREVTVWDVPPQVQDQMDPKLRRPFEFPRGWEVQEEAVFPEEVMAQIGGQPERWLRRLNQGGAAAVWLSGRNDFCRPKDLVGNQGRPAGSACRDRLRHAGYPEWAVYPHPGRNSGFGHVLWADRSCF